MEQDRETRNGPYGIHDKVGTAEKWGKDSSLMSDVGSIGYPFEKTKTKKQKT